MRAARFLPCAALALSACVMLPGMAQAEGLQVAPVAVTIPARSSVVFVSNQGASPLRAQVRVFRWSQQDGEDMLAETTELVASPPFVTVASGSQQVVRLVRLGEPDAGVPCEQTYRIIVDELPAGEQPPSDGLRYVMRFSIPVYLTNPACGEITPALGWWIEQAADGPALVVQNTGQQHAQLADLAMVDLRGNRREVAAGLVGYVLPGQTRHFSLSSVPAAAAGGTLEVSVNGIKVIASVALAQTGQ